MPAVQTLLSVRACTQAWAFYVRACLPGAGWDTAAVNASGVLIVLHYFPDTFL